MHNIVTVAELKRRGMAALEDGLKRGPVHIVKRNRPAAVVLSEEDYRQLVGNRSDATAGQTALQWLLAQPSSGTRSKAEIDADLAAERNW